MAKSKKKPYTASVKPPSHSLYASAPSKTLKDPHPSNVDPKRLATTPVQQKLSFTAPSVAFASSPPTAEIPLLAPALNPLPPALHARRSEPPMQTDLAIKPTAQTSILRNAKNSTGAKLSEQPPTTGVTANNATKTSDITMTEQPEIIMATPPAPLTRKSLRYRITIGVEADDKKPPLEAFADNFKAVLTAVQLVAGKALWIGPWDEEQESSGFPIIKKKSDIPDGKKPDRHRNIFNIYTNSYINPKKEGSNIWMQLRFVHEQPIQVDLHKLGEAVQDAFTDLPFSVRFYRQPNHCQAASVACLGWLYGSTKSISEQSFTEACRSSLGIPAEVPFGIQWRTITDRLNKRPAFDKENPPPSALHLDIDQRFAHLIQKRAGELWRKYDKQKHRPALPNDIQLRLVPCFSSEFSDARKTPKTEENVVLMAGKQKYFVTEYIEKVEIPFIRFLDTPLSDTNEITLRRALMARAPKLEPTKRLIHNVDFSWNDAHKVVATTIKKFRGQTKDFISTLIPEMVFRYGQESQKWFSEDGIRYFNNVTWDPTTLSTTAEADATTQALVDEDLWDLGDDWKSSVVARQPPAQVGTVIKKTEKNKNKVTTRLLENDDDIKSFASAFGVEPTSESSPPGEDTGQTKAGGTVKLSSGILRTLNAKQPAEYEKDNLSMSTAARTTESTRVKLHAAKSTISEQATVLQNQAIELARLQRLLQRQNLDEPIPMDLQTVELEVDTSLLTKDTPLRATDTYSTGSPMNDATKALITPLPSSPKEVIELDLATDDSPPKQHADSPISAIYGDDDTLASDNSSAESDEDTVQILQIASNLRSKFSEAKSSAVSTRSSVRSPPKKVRFTHSKDGRETPSDQGSDDEFPPPDSSPAHHPKAAQAVVDPVDDGSGA